jgi:hypothetical protein
MANKLGEAIAMALDEAYRLSVFPHSFATASLPTQNCKPSWVHAANIVAAAYARVAQVGTSTLGRTPLALGTCPVWSCT